MGSDKSGQVQCTSQMDVSVFVIVFGTLSAYCLSWKILINNLVENHCNQNVRQALGLLKSLTNFKILYSVIF